MANRTKTNNMILNGARIQNGDSFEDATEVAADLADGGEGFNWKQAVATAAIGAGAAIVAGTATHVLREHVIPKKKTTLPDILDLSEAQWANIVDMVPQVNAGIEAEKARQRKAKAESHPKPSGDADA